MAGLYWFKQDIDSTQLFFQENVGYSGYNLPELGQESWAAFGQATFEVTDRLRLTGGLRYTTEDTRQRGVALAPTAPAIPDTPAGQIPSIGEATFESTDYRARVEFDLAEQ